MKTKKIATFGLLIALAFIFSYIESIIPIPFPVPGMKLGLANIVVITALYSMGSKEAISLSILRILLISFTFGNPLSLAYSLAGGFLSCLSMILCKKSKLFSMVGVSVLGGVSHNIGQIIVAIIVIHNMNLIYYLPVLIITGLVTGILIGILASNVVKRVRID